MQNFLYFLNFVWPAFAIVGFFIAIYLAVLAVKKAVNLTLSVFRLMTNRGPRIQWPAIIDSN